jgi:DNA-binding MarR family transcriptional regulator
MAPGGSVVPSEIEDLGLLIKRVQYAHHVELNARMLAEGASLIQWNALREIHRNPGASQHRLAELTFDSDQAFGTLVRRLTKRGWVARRSAPGRAHRHELTSAGRAIFSKGQVVMVEVLSETVGRLSPTDRRRLARLLTRVHAAQGELRSRRARRSRRIVQTSR